MDSLITQLREERERLSQRIRKIDAALVALCDSDVRQLAQVSGPSGREYGAISRAVSDTLRDGVPRTAREIASAAGIAVASAKTAASAAAAAGHLRAKRRPTDVGRFGYVMVYSLAGAEAAE
jgi:hypothetical protein